MREIFKNEELLKLFKQMANFNPKLRGSAEEIGFTIREIIN